MKKKPVQFIAVEMGWGAQRHETATGPSVLQEKLALHYEKILVSKTPYNTEKKLSFEERLHEVEGVSQELMQVVSKSLANNYFPFIIGGDDSIAIGLWSGAVQQLHAQQQFGLLWIDAHMDSHTPQTTPSMAIHGMPLAVLLGQGEKSLVELGGISPKLAPQNIALIGVRSYQESEAQLLKKMGVKIVYCDEVLQRGLYDVLQEALEHITKNTIGFGVNLDLDVFDPTLMPGVGSPVLDGISNLTDIARSFDFIHQHPLLKAFSMSEYNPKYDHHYHSISLIKAILAPWMQKT